MFAPTPLRDVILKLCRRENLTRDEARSAFADVLAGRATDAQLGGLLVGLAAKGSTVDELVAAAGVMRGHAVGLGVPDDPANPTLDTCGTGGDVKGTFNVSTAAALIAAAAGARVVKHGNRSASGNAGSADVLERLGVNLDATPRQQAACLATANVCFAFARGHHPAMRHVAAARASLGVPTLFNVLGPLTNPAGAKHQLLGVFAPELTERLAAVLREMGSTRAWVVHADDGLDEISTMEPTLVGELRDGRVTTWRLDAAAELGLRRARLDDLRVDGVDDAAAAVRLIADGRPGPMRDVAAVNAAAALVVAGRAGKLAEGYAVADAALSAGAVRRTLDALVTASRSVPSPGTPGEG